MNILSCIVLEDEEPAQKLLRHHANQIPEMNLMATFDNAIEATDFLNQTHVDLIITDIEMPRLNGLDFIRMLSHRPLVVITTAYPEYALEGYELDIVDYIVKPVTLERFKKAIEKAQRFLPNIHEEHKSSDSNMIYVKESGVLVKVELKDIIYVEGFADYVKVVTESRTIKTLMTMSKMLETLASQRFMRVHKSYIINTDKIATIDSVNSFVVMNDKKGITLGRAYKHDFMARFKAVN